SELAAASMAAEDQQWQAKAQLVLQRRFGDAPPKDARERARQIRFLQYRGFTSDQIRQALGRVADDLD
ncbi:MAG: RecX family transcriptional regulator, partial [Moraxellaceae bacterium]|nr:RecX family transcriptional regulator [Moraxellaceae bacterium]